MEDSLSAATELCTHAHQLAYQKRPEATDTNDRQRLDTTITLLERLAASLAELEHILGNSELAYQLQSTPSLSSICLSLQECVLVFQADRPHDPSSDFQGTQLPAQPLKENTARSLSLGLVAAKIQVELEQLQQWQDTVLAFEIDSLRNRLVYACVRNLASILLTVWL